MASRWPPLDRATTPHVMTAGGKASHVITEHVAERWDLELDDLFVTIGHRFSRVELRRRMRDYVHGLLAPVARKNSWQLAEQAGHATPNGLQHLLAGAKWEPDDIRDELQEYVAHKLGEDSSSRCDLRSRSWTPAEVVPFLMNPVSSMMRTPSKRPPPVRAAPTRHPRGMNGRTSDLPGTPVMPEAGSPASDRWRTGARPHPCVDNYAMMHIRKGRHPPTPLDAPSGNSAKSQHQYRAEPLRNAMNRQDQ